MGDIWKPEDLAKLDFLKTLYWNLNMPRAMQENLVTQSIHGHMTQGHGVFRGQADEKLFIEDVYTPLRKNSKKAREKREEEIMEVFDLVDRLAEGKTNRLVKSNGEPIMGFEPFRNYEITNNPAGLKGSVIMGCVDDKFWRQDTMNHFQKTLNGENYNIGYGKEYLVDKQVMKSLGFNQTSLAKKAFSNNDIKELRKKGMIKRSPGKNIENLFVRRNDGSGCCDDLMLSSIGLIHGEDAMIMAWAIDALDTYTKFIANPKEGGYDQVLSQRIHDRWLRKYGEALAKPEEIREIIYLGAKDNFPKMNLSSSHRRFIQTEESQNYPTIINHMNYVKTGERPKDYSLGFTKVSSDKFYDTLEERFRLYNKQNLIPKTKKQRCEKKVKRK